MLGRAQIDSLGPRTPCFGHFHIRDPSEQGSKGLAVELGYPEAGAGGDTRVRVLLAVNAPQNPPRLPSWKLAVGGRG